MMDQYPAMLAGRPSANGRESVDLISKYGLERGDSRHSAFRLQSPRRSSPLHALGGQASAGQPPPAVAALAGLEYSVSECSCH